MVLGGGFVAEVVYASLEIVLAFVVSYRPSDGCSWFVVALWLQVALGVGEIGVSANHRMVGGQ